MLYMAFYVPSKVLYGLQMFIKSEARIVIGFTRISGGRFIPFHTTYNFLPVEAGVIYKICLLIY